MQIKHLRLVLAVLISSLGTMAKADEKKVCKGEVISGTHDSAVGNCDFITRSATGDRIFSVCKMGDQCVVEAIGTRGTVATEIVRVLSVKKISKAVEDQRGIEPFFGEWSCSQLIDGETVDRHGFSGETYGPKGARMGAPENWTKLKIRKIDKNIFDLFSDEGFWSRLIIKEKWLMVRATEEHQYVCLR